MNLTPHLSPLTSREDTICALATPPGGALGIIRISGPQMLGILSHVFSKDLSTAQPNTIHYGHIVERDAVFPHQQVIDEVMVSIFRAPHSYTGEDSAEISCHGSHYILNKVLELLIQQGCRMANPGEYTMRAYLNGKMDLSQAEAVADLIASSNEATHQMAMSQLRGGISTELSRLRDQLLKLTSLLELELDFSDHEDLEFADRGKLFELAKNIDKYITKLAKSFETGQAIKQGIPVAIVGKTNVGKSTLLNALLKDDRAIVSNVHGTTRDTIEDTIDINGITFRFIDTAGIRQTSDQVEQIGIERTYAAIDKARIIIWMVDKEPSLEELNKMMLLSDSKKLIVVKNKIDKAESTPFTLVKIPLIEISAKHGTHLPDLEQAIYETADIPTLQQSDIIVTNARHYDALTRAHSHLQRVIDGLATSDSSLFTHHPSLPPDLLSEDLRLTLDTLSEITGGQITPNEVLGNIFKNFCVGK
ncbi:MAG: tRNA uridine-5-carboxymethylaminomethyl(34) synthesis GTPase MnmE [Prevotella sp.]|nr:tRNA uridine-5-carboxymethylaminomethyl(34) synthesis GTPase MnmE [Prevotella sp.]